MLSVGCMKIGMNVEMEWKDDNELQLMAGDRPQANPIKVGNKLQDKSLFLFLYILLIINYDNINNKTSTNLTTLKINQLER